MYTVIEVRCGGYCMNIIILEFLYIHVITILYIHTVYIFNTIMLYKSYVDATA